MIAPRSSSSAPPRIFSKHYTIARPVRLLIDVLASTSRRPAGYHTLALTGLIAPSVVAHRVPAVAPRPVPGNRLHGLTGYAPALRFPPGNAWHIHELSLTG